MSSKFAGIFAGRKNEDVPPPDDTPAPSPAPASEDEGGPRRIAQAPVAAPPRKLGRPAGKRSDPAFAQVTAYIRKETHLGVQIRLLKEGKSQEFSELVEDLLRTWLRSRP